MIRKTFSVIALAAVYAALKSLPFSDVAMEGIAAAAIGLSRETAYCRRRRDPLFARAWAAAMLLAREEGGHILADRALDGVGS